MKKLLSLLSLCAILLLAGCQEANILEAPATDKDEIAVPVAPIQTNNFHVWSPFRDYLTDLCDVEDVVVEGRFRLKDAATRTESGRLNLRFHMNAEGTGVGQTSGATYQWNESFKETASFDLSEGAPFITTSVRTVNLVGQGQAPNLKVKARFHVTVNANGEVTARISEFEEVCK